MKEHHHLLEHYVPNLDYPTGNRGMSRRSIHWLKHGGRKAAGAS